MKTLYIEDYIVAMTEIKIQANTMTFHKIGLEN